jgi:hypothetical protein
MSYIVHCTIRRRQNKSATQLTLIGRHPLECGCLQAPVFQISATDIHPVNRQVARLYTRSLLNVLCVA